MSWALGGRLPSVHAATLQRVCLPTSPHLLHCALAADDIYIRPDDLLAFQGSLPINGGNRTVVLRGGKAGASREGASACTLDWGEVVDLLFHPAGHSFYAYNLILQARTAVQLPPSCRQPPLVAFRLASFLDPALRRPRRLQGMAPSAAGYAAGLGTQMVAGVFWPTTTGEPGHLVRSRPKRLSACLHCCALP